MFWVGLLIITGDVIFAFKVFFDGSQWLGIYILLSALLMLYILFGARLARLNKDEFSDRYYKLESKIKEQQRLLDAISIQLNIVPEDIENIIGEKETAKKKDLNPKDMPVGSTVIVIETYIYKDVHENEITIEKGTIGKIYGKKESKFRMMIKEQDKFIFVDAPLEYIQNYEQYKSENNVN